VRANFVASSECLRLFLKRGVQSVGVQLLPRSKVLRREPSAATMSATSGLFAVTLMISAVVGDLIRSQCAPSVVSNMVPCCPTTQHTVLLGAWPARRRAFTPLSCCCQLFPSIERKIAPESPSAQ
jgi:hypothetical protein